MVRIIAVAAIASAALLSGRAGWAEQAMKFTTIQAPGYSYTVPFAVNRRGEVVGIVSNGNGPTLGFTYIYFEFTVFNIKKSQYVNAQGANSRGVIVGNYRDPKSADNAFRSFTMKGRHVKSFDLQNVLSTYATSLNDSGEIGGYVAPSDMSVNGFLLLGGAVTYVNLGDQRFTSVAAVNNNGDFAGAYHDSN